MGTRCRIPDEERACGFAMSTVLDRERYRRFQLVFGKIRCIHDNDFVESSLAFFSSVEWNGMGPLIDI